MSDCKRLLQRMDAGRPLFLFLDYDGTLVPIRARPEQAVLSPRRRRELELLRKNAFLCIVTGRSLGDIRSLVGASPAALIANHGLEIFWKGKLWTHTGAGQCRPVLRKALRKIRPQLAGFPGAWLEDKGLTVSVHYRLLAPSKHRALMSLVEEEVGAAGEGIKRVGGKKVLELRPDVDWGKGRGVLELWRRLDVRKPVSRIYMGDDETDEDAFRMLGRRWITIKVGRRGRTSARWRLGSVDDVWAFLMKIRLQSA